MRKTVEFSTPEEIRKIRESTPSSSTRKGSYTDSLLHPKYAARKLRFPIGKTMVRLVQSIKPSVFDWMIQVQALNYPGGRHTHPRTLGAGKSVFDHAFSWLKSSKPDVLFSRGNRDGYRLLADPVSLIWAIVEENGVEKTQPPGVKYASYSLRLGNTPTPMSKLISLMAEEEVEALCPLENTIRILSEDEEWERLEQIGINSETISAIRSSIH